MRELTLQEKITFKGLLARKGIIVPLLDMPSLKHFWRMAYGSTLDSYPKVPFTNK